MIDWGWAYDFRLIDILNERERGGMGKPCGQNFREARGEHLDSDENS